MISVKQLPIGKTIKTLFKNPTYVCVMVTITSLYFVVTGVQYWITYYLQIVIGADVEMVYILYSASSITGPTLGVLVLPVKSRPLYSMIV